MDHADEKLIAEGEAIWNALPEAERTAIEEQAFPGGFEGCVAAMRRRPGVTNPEGLCAFIGRKFKPEKFRRKVTSSERDRPADQDIAEALKISEQGNVDALIEWAAGKGWRGCVSSLSGKQGITDPERLCGWLKNQARIRGLLSESVRGRLLESRSGMKWRAVLIEEGESLNGRVYTRETLGQMADLIKAQGKLPAMGFVFRTDEGKLIDHSPEGINEADFPDEVVGLHENPEIVEEAGKARLETDFTFIDEALGAKTLAAWNEGKRDLFGFSINADGFTAQPNGRGAVQFVTNLKSGDVVSFPSARGHFSRLVASMGNTATKKSKKATLIGLIADHAPSLLEGKDVAKLTEGDVVALAKKLSEMMHDEDRETLQSVIDILSAMLKKPEMEEEPEMSENAGDKFVKEAQAAKESAERALASLAEAEKRIAAKEWASAVKESIDAAGLDGDAADLVRETFSGRVGEKDALAKFVEKQKKICAPAPSSAFSALAESAAGSSARTGTEERDRITRAFDGYLAGKDLPINEKDPKSEKVPAFYSFRQFCEAATGRPMTTHDRMGVLCAAGQLLNLGLEARHQRAQGRMSESAYRDHRRGATDMVSRMISGSGVRALREAITIAQLGEITADRFAKQALDDYELSEFVNDVRAIAWRETGKDNFQTERWIRLGEVATLANVAEDAAYVAITSPTDEEATLTITKRGGTETVTMEAIANDDQNIIPRVPGRLSRAAAVTLYRDIFDSFYTNVSTTFDSSRVINDGFTGGPTGTDHNNAVSGAAGATNLTEANLDLLRQRMLEQSAFAQATHTLGVANAPEVLIVGAADEAVARRFAEGPFRPTTSEFEEVNIHRGLRVIVVPYWVSAVNRMRWMLLNKRNPGLVISYFENRRNPEIFVQDMPNVGSWFTNDRITYKVRFIWGRTHADYRAFAGAYRTS